NRPDATAALHGLTLAISTPQCIARAAFEGLLCGLADGIDALVRQGTVARRIVLVGGGARSAALCRIAPTVLGHPVLVPTPGEYVADGAARQAAWVLSGSEQPPAWPMAGSAQFDGEAVPGIRDRYADARDLTLTRGGFSG
ncbi:MAG: FGGY-family carbohydrate kinase, partial [Actinomycetes bacterium]